MIVTVKILFHSAFSLFSRGYYLNTNIFHNCKLFKYLSFQLQFESRLFDFTIEVNASRTWYFVLSLQQSSTYQSHSKAGHFLKVHVNNITRHFSSSVFLLFITEYQELVKQHRSMFGFEYFLSSTGQYYSSAG